MKTLVWLLAFALPMQNLAVVSLELRGPAHIHAQTAAEDPPQEGHAHSDAERHYHGPDEGAIEVDDHDDHHHEALALESSKTSPTGSSDAVLSTSRPPVVRSETDGIASIGMKVPPPPFLGRLERPPASLPAAPLFS